jgi:L-alanine-DL-glutamate epimerase-like enolase superfamily enzyme
MGKATDIGTVGAALYFLPVQTRVALKFGAETLTQVTCARACVKVSDEQGRTAEGWGETPLSVQWVWPSATAYEERHAALKAFCLELADLWASIRTRGHPIELGHGFLETVLPGWLQGFNQRHRRGREPMPWLAALVCCSPFDLAVHDAYGQLHGCPTYETYHAGFMNRDLGCYLRSAQQSGVSFQGKYPADFLTARRSDSLVAWHLVGGLDLLEASELTGKEPDDGYPVLLEDWIRRDGLQCLKVKLRGNDAEWDWSRLVKVGSIGLENGVCWLSADFNCTVTDAQYVNVILDRLRDEQPRIYGMILYVEQPFPYDLERHRMDVRSVSGRKPLFLDESAHDWRLVQLGRELGWSGVALKTCKTQTGALLSACWARAHGMSLMVQDLTNPMLAQIPHVLLAAHAGTIMGVETNAMQFYPDASRPEAAVHPNLYQRRQGKVQLASLRGPGFGYRLQEIRRDLPQPAAECSA